MKKPEGKQRLEDLEKKVRELEGALNLHFRTEITKAHPRTGSVEEVKRYLGIE